MLNLSSAATALSWKPYRLAQVQRAREIELVRSWSEITTLPKPDRDYLTAEVPFDSLTIEKIEEAADGSAVKFLLRAADKATFEMVLLLHSGEKKRWGTVCLSSQIGCPVRCSFCATGQMQWERNITSEEILDQFLIAKRAARERGIDSNLNVVFMGMGEPLLNLEHVVPAIRVLTHPKRHALGGPRITVSTSGIIPGLVKLRAENLGIGLALSLHSPLDELRTQLMPINQTFPLAEIFAELKNWECLGTHILYEYILIAGITDTPECLTALIGLLRGRTGKLNLIPYNPVPRSSFQRPTSESMQQFRYALEQAGITAMLRHTKGDDIAAACGQLKSK